MKKILIIQTASIGDVILATPVLEKLHAYYPEARIDFFLKKGNESLFAGHPFLGKVYIWDKSSRKYKHLYQLIKRVRKEEYDWVVCLQRFFSAGLVALFSKGKRTVGFDKNPLSRFFTKRVRHIIGSAVFPVHEVERNLSLIADCTDTKFQKPVLYPSAEDEAKVLPYKTQRYICVAPLSLWFTKQLPVEKWIEFATKADPSVWIYYLGSTSDIPVCDAIISRSEHANSFNLAGKLNLLESAALMRGAVMNFMNDSAPLHLASSTNAPTTAVFCSTVLAFGFGPLSDDSLVIQTEEKLDCRPCGLHGHKECPQKHFKCGKTIQVEQLLERIAD